MSAQCAMIILHGENTVQSRARLGSLLDAARAKQHDTIRLEAKTLTEALAEEMLGASSLFGTERTITIEGLHSLQTSARKKALIEYLGTAQDQAIILWESRTLTKPMLKKFAQAKVEEFKLSKSLFTWLDSLGTRTPAQRKLELLHSSVQSEGAHVCFLMLVRQVRLLLQLKNGGKPAGPPFMIAKLKRQAQHFSVETLLNLHSKLYSIDQNMKYPESLLSLEQELDLCTLEL